MSHFLTFEIPGQNECVKYFFHADLNWAFLFIKLVRLHGKLLSILLTVWYIPFWKHERFAVGLWRWYLLVVWILHTSEFVWNFLWPFKMKFINDSVYSHGGKVSNFINIPLCKFLGFAPSIILTFFCCRALYWKMNYPLKLFCISSQYQNRQITCFENVAVADTVYRPTYIICCT